jgi:hypothetical protein
LLAASRAFTWNVWEPSARPVYVFGLVHAEKPPPSSWQTKDAPTSVSEKANVALAELLGFDGLDVIVGTGGGTVSTVHV